MRRKSSEQLTAAEWKVMKVVWDIESGSSREIYERAGEKHDWAYTTVKTILSSLVNKKFLKTRQDGNKFVYSPAKPAINTLMQAADDFIDRSVEGVKGRLLCYMANRIELSEEDVQELQAILDQQKEKGSTS
ncbi:MAG: BlaI/MecI/CopY family transcriptional regulator [Candidatus Omnitrophota bacterium]